MVRLRLLGPARDAAGGVGAAELDGGCVAEVLDTACARFGERFAVLLRTSAVWVNGEPATSDRAVGNGDEIAVVPPVSGG